MEYGVGVALDIISDPYVMSADHQEQLPCIWSVLLSATYRGLVRKCTKTQKGSVGTWVVSSAPLV